jgi:hypothetical protein
MFLEELFANPTRVISVYDIEVTSFHRVDLPSLTAERSMGMLPGGYLDANVEEGTDTHQAAYAA